MHRQDTARCGLGSGMSRPGARCQHCCWSVSPGRSPNPPCVSPRNGLSMVPAVGWFRQRPTVKLGLHLRYPPTRTPPRLIGRVGVHAGGVTIRWRGFRHYSLQLLLVSEASRNHCRPSPCGRLSRTPRQVVTPATTTAAPPHPWPVGRRCAQPDARRWPRRHRADQGRFPCSLVDRSTEEASDSTPATSPWLPRSTSPRPPLSPADMSGSSPPP
jgi:hypothetical protein